MARTKKEPIYRELGLLLEEWRSERYRSCLALFKENKFSFSYDSYVEFENGKALPSIPVLLEIADSFSKDRRIALLLWAKVQMPGNELDSFYSSEIQRIEKRTHQRAKEPSSGRLTPTVSMDTTWVFGLPERDLLLANPWLWDVCGCLSTAFPNEVPFGEVPLPINRRSGNDEGKSQLLSILQPWITAQHILASNEGLRLRLPHIHLPKTPDWEEVRRNNFIQSIHAAHAFHNDVVREDSNFYRFVFQRPLSSEQTVFWTQRLRELEKEFASEPYSVTAEEIRKGNTQVLAILFGTRRLRR